MFLDYKDLSSREAYDFYRENRKSVAKGIDQYNYFQKAVEGVFKTLKRMFLDNEEGVCIRDLGYFCMIKREGLVVTRNPKNVSVLKKYKKRHMYRPYFFADSMYDNWHMDGAFTKQISYELSKNHTSRYKIHKTICDSVIISEDFQLTVERNKKNPKRNANYKKEERK